MQEYFILKLKVSNPDNCDAWVLNKEHKIVQHFTDTSLIELNEHDNNRRTIAIVPGQQLMLSEVKLPPCKPAQRQQVATFAIEEHVSQNIEELHVAAGSTLKSGKTIVAWLTQTIMRMWYKLLINTKVIPTDMMPEMLTIPWKEKAWCITINNDIAVVRTGQGSGFTIELDNLLPLIELQLNDKETIKPEKLIIYSQQDHNLTLSDSSINIEQRSPLSDEAMVEEAIKSIPLLNLLQGQYQGQSIWKKHYIYWKKTLTIAGILLLTVFSSKVIQYGYLSYHHAKLSKEVTTVYNNLFPGNTQLLSPRNLIADERNRLEDNLAIYTMQTLISSVSDIIPNYPEINLRSVSFQNNNLTMQLTSNSFTSLEEFKVALENDELIIIAQRSNQVGDQIEASITLRK